MEIKGDKVFQIFLFRPLHEYENLKNCPSPSLHPAQPWCKETPTPSGSWKISWPIWRASWTWVSLGPSCFDPCMVRRVLLTRTNFLRAHSSRRRPARSRTRRGEHRAAARASDDAARQDCGHGRDRRRRPRDPLLRPAAVARRGSGRRARGGRRGHDHPPGPLGRRLVRVGRRRGRRRGRGRRRRGRGRRPRRGQRCVAPVRVVVDSKRERGAWKMSRTCRNPTKTLVPGVMLCGTNEAANKNKSTTL